MSYADRETLTILAKQNWRGIPTERLVYFIQDAKEQFDNLQGDFKIGFARIPLGCTKEEWLDNQRYYFEQSIQSIEQEFERRGRLTYVGVLHTNKEIIQTIKTTLKIEDVLEWYTEVFLHKKVWTYRCTLHGKDEHPSGVIYPKEGRCHCFTCLKGGDVFDVMQHWERIDLPQAIAKLARHLGLDTKPLIRQDKKFGIKDIAV